ncbi:hypothetical protein [Sphingomonas qomolangmaensis]|uniref:Uncharacterized protein n=1 Tax=Sphingomonas qomolangmaensis TaxID=2918765 RepID=A0ABY5L802_9SPHN|nr:hypothetical protein [Sphingomonas qomolangmaensis]UUL82076.1 hypothetical protein NMP03_12905 [Sphingomonas qomolangmaensis]
MAWVATWLALAAGSQIWDGGRTAFELPTTPIAIRPADGTRDITESIRDGRRSGQLDRREARSLRRDVRIIGALGDRFDQDGLSPSEAQELAVRTEALRGLAGAKRLSGGKP